MGRGRGARLIRSPTRAPRARQRRGTQGPRRSAASTRSLSRRPLGLPAEPRRCGGAPRAARSAQPRHRCRCGGPRAHRRGGRRSQRRYRSRHRAESSCRRCQCRPRQSRACSPPSRSGAEATARSASSVVTPRSSAPSEYSDPRPCDSTLVSETTSPAERCSMVLTDVVRRGVGAHHDSAPPRKAPAARTRVGGAVHHLAVERVPSRWGGRHARHARHACGEHHVRRPQRHAPAGASASPGLQLDFPSPVAATPVGGRHGTGDACTGGHVKVHGGSVVLQPVGELVARSEDGPRGGEGHVR
eukprot:scaffold17685_cov63-Phaeocystis_antarctica.AAC.5